VDFDKVYAEHYSYVYKYVLSLCRNETVAEDITSEAFLKALKNIGGYKGACEIRVWICQIAKHTYFTLRKSDGRAEPLEAEPLEAAPQSESAGTIEETLANRMEAFEIHRILHSLGEPYKEVFSLRLFGELPFAAIAELFGKTESWARVTYHRAKTKIKEEMK
jgi:RNA polymerase sigma-70 factor (ECF subfamily)